MALITGAPVAVISTELCANSSISVWGRSAGFRVRFLLSGASGISNPEISSCDAPSWDFVELLLPLLLSLLNINFALFQRVD